MIKLAQAFAFISYFVLLIFYNYFMHRFFIKTPWWAKQVFPYYIWNMSRQEKNIYLSFDDGPHPEITLFVLAELRKYNAAATFFCIGNNVALYPEVYQQILDEGHAVGNHTYNHPNGWETPIEEYLNDIKQASKYIQSNLFRPPYGRIKRKQARLVKEAMNNETTRIIMWDVLSADFDTSFSPQSCLDNVIRNCTNGSIVVFHDSEKAFRNLKYSLPEAMRFLANNGFFFRKIEWGGI
jgi:peptidoglycan/xylan/chitin deacetylase (PgdA/CDA1 family)